MVNLKFTKHVFEKAQKKALIVVLVYLCKLNFGGLDKDP